MISYFLKANLMRSSTGSLESTFSNAAAASFNGKPKAIRASRASSGSVVVELVLTSVAP